MKNLTIPQAILFGLSLIALAIASTSFAPSLVHPAMAETIYGKQDRPIYVRILSYKEN